MIGQQLRRVKAGLTPPAMSIGALLALAIALAIISLGVCFHIKASGVVTRKRIAAHVGGRFR
jgi:hypothetical protein